MGLEVGTLKPQGRFRLRQWERAAVNVKVKDVELT